MEGVDFSWHGNPVLCDINLALAPGTVTMLHGPNGAGKTTLIRILAGGLDPDAGHVTLGGIDAAADRRAYLRRVGLASAGDRGLYARLDVLANIQLAAAVALARARRQCLIAETLQRFQLHALARQRVDRLSMGQRQRVRLALAFLHEPCVVLLDEPTTSLDREGTALLAVALEALAARGASALWSAPADASPALPADRTCTLTTGSLEVVA